MKFNYKKDYKCRYYIIINNKENTKNIIPLMLKIPKQKYEDFLRDNGAFLDLNGHMYFYDKEKVINTIKQLNGLIRKE